MSPSLPKDIRRQYREGRLLLFVGAGASMSVSWVDGSGKKLRGPSWTQLVDQAMLQLHFTRPELLRARGTDLHILEYYKQKTNSFQPLANWLLLNMTPPDSALENSPIHSAIAEMEHCHLIYTTNYDDFIERGLRLHRRDYRVIATETDMCQESKGCDVVKFHGDLAHPDRMVLSESQYQERISFASEMDYRLKADLLGRYCLFIGYSFTDWNVSYLFQMIHKLFENLPRSDSGRRAGILVSDPSEFERELFLARKIDVIPIRGSNRTEDVAALLREIRR